MAQVMKKRSLVNSGRRRKVKRNYGTRLGRSWSTATSAGKAAGASIGRYRTAKRAGWVSKRKQAKRWSRLGNSGRRKKPMTAKQIKYFGTARQRAALRARGGGKRRRNAGVWSTRKTKKRVKRAGVLYSSKLGSNAKRTFRKARKSRGRRKNIGQIFSIGLAGLAGGNPGRKRKRGSKKRVSNRKRSLTTMARRRRRNTGRRKSYSRSRARRVYVHRRRRRTSNPGSYRRRRRVSNVRHHRRRRNAGAFSGTIGSTTGMLKNALSVIGGAVATRYATQLALGANNTGAIGYLANAIAALALGWAAGKFMKSPQVGSMVTLGGFTGLALRMLSDLTPIGQYVNLSLSGAGKAGDTGIGLITDTTFYVPTVFNQGSMTSAMVPNQITQLIAAGSVGSKAGVGNYRRRRAA